MIVFFLCGLCRSYKSALFLASSVLRNCGCALNVVYRESEMSEKDFADLKNRLKIIFEADPSQYHNDHSLRRYLKAFKTVDEAFQVNNSFNPSTKNLLHHKMILFLRPY